MFKLKNEKNLLFFLILLILSCIFAYLLLTNIKNEQEIPVVAAENDTLIDQSPTPAVATTSKTITQISPEGSLELILQTKEISPDKIHYSIFVKENKSSKETKIFDEIVDNQIETTIPFNTWSPDNKHFFIKQIYKNAEKFLVFKTSGEEFKNVRQLEVDSIETGNKKLDITQYFVQKEIPYEIDEVTGWASPLLLVVNTQGPTYWFDLTNQSFIQLSTKF